jgi:hypothetical protein
MAESGTRKVRARGLLFVTLGEWLSVTKGDEALGDLKDSLAPETKQLVISAQKGGWYPLEQLVSALRAYASKYRPDKVTWGEFGVFLSDVSLMTSFRGLIVFIDPVTLMKRIPLFWGRYFDGCDMNVENVREKEAVLSLDLPFETDVISPLFSGWLRHALELVGADKIGISGEGCRWKARWRWPAE